MSAMSHHHARTPRLIRPLVVVAAVAATLLATVTGQVSAQAAPAAPAPAAAAAPARVAPAATARVAPAATAASATTQPDHRPDAKGPIGWDVYRRLDRVDEVTTGVETHQFSSFDRGGGNDDGFAGTYSCLRTTAAGCVIAERAGAGEVESIWFTRDEGDVSRTGNITVELDGRTVLDAPIQDVVNGTTGGAFVYPFVANADESSGGVFIKVPMPYRTSMRVTMTNNPLFYHVDYRTFADTKGVTTFDPKVVPADVLAASKTWGSADPKPARPSTEQKDTFSLKPGQKAQVADVRGSGELSALRLQVPQIVGPPQLPLISDDGRAHKGTSQFTVKVDPANQGVKLTRRFDANSAQQVANIYVDGAKVGQWPATQDTPGHWAYQTVTLPASATAGKSSVTVRNEFVSATIDWNEFHYWADSVVNGTDVRTDELDVGTSTAALASEQAHAYVITGQTWTGAPNQTDKPENPNDPKVLASNELLRNVMVRVTFDGTKTVESPLGEFFGSGLTESPVSSLFYQVDTSPNGWYSSWWPMPYASRVTVELVNNSSERITAGRSSVSTVADPSIGRELRRPDSRIGYFNATHHRADTVEGQDWAFLDTAATGRFVGVSHTMRGHIPTGNLREYLEGDERVYADGSRSPAWHGTGTEDFYESGWYFNRREFSNPTNGATAMPVASFGCQYQCDSPYRLLIGDAVSFRSGMTFGIEHGPVDNASAEYSSTAYWYGFDGKPGARVTDTVDIGNRASEKAHGYTGSASAAPLTATFEGDQDVLPVTDDVASATAPVSFTVAVDPGNTGVTLRRLSDQSNGYQSAQVTVDGTAAGTWLQPLKNTTHRWLEDTFQIDPSLTDHRRQVTITVTPTSGAPAWSAASYTALSSVNPARDRHDPSAVTGVVATGGEGNSNHLTWPAATDDVAVHHYEVYGSRSGSVAPSPKTLVGTTALSSFEHTGLGLKETWHYVVRAVDSSGNTGAASRAVSATTGDSLRIEGESLLPAVSATADVSAQGNCCGVTWSGNQQLWFQGTKAGDTVSLHFTVPVAGTYDATAALTQAADYGIVQVAVDGVDVGAPVDAYAPTGVAVADHPLGAVTLTKGQHTLTLTLTGHNPAATSYMAGLDVLGLHLTG